MSGWTGWTAPPKPGLIPLRPLTFGQLLGTPFRVLRHNPKPLLGVALVVQAVVTAASLLLVGVVFAQTTDRLDHASAADYDTIAAGGVSIMILSALATIVLTLVAAALVQGLVIVDVSRAALGEKPTGRELWRATRGRRWRVIGYLGMLAAGVVIAIGVIAVAVTLAALAAAAAGVAASVLSGIGIALVVGGGFAVLFAWLYTKTSLTPSVIVLEGVGVRRGIARSWQLTRGAFWRTLGTQLLVALICYVAAQIIQTPIALVILLSGSLLSPGADPQSAGAAQLVSYAVTGVVSAVVGAITQIVESSTTALIYLDQRMRLEGLDITLERHLEDVYAGRPAADPFLAP